MIDLTIKLKNRQLVVGALLKAGDYAVDGQVRAANRTASRGRTLGIRQIAAATFLKSSYIRERIELRQATRNKPVASLISRKRETRMDRFPWKQVSKPGKSGRARPAGIQVSLKKDRAAKIIRSAFIVGARRGRIAGAGGAAIAVRVSVLQKLGYRIDSGSLGGSGSRRYEILHTSSVRDLFADQLGSGGLLANLQTYLEQQMASEMQRAVTRATQ